MDADTKRGIDTVKTDNKKVAHKAADKKEKKYRMNYERYYKMEHYETSKLLKDSTVSKFVTKNGPNWLINQVINIPLTKIWGLNLLS